MSLSEDLVFKESYYGNNIKAYKESYIRTSEQDDIKHGLQEYWFITGQLSHIDNYKSVASPEGANGKKHGIQKDWYFNKHNLINDQLMCESNYVYEERHGIQQGWDKSGAQEYKYNFVYGKQHGKQIRDDIYYIKYGKKITKDEYERYLYSIKNGILNILHIGKNTLDLVITRYLINI